MKHFWEHSYQHDFGDCLRGGCIILDFKSFGFAFEIGYAWLLR